MIYRKKGDIFNLFWQNNFSENYLNLLENTRKSEK